MADVINTKVAVVSTRNVDGYKLNKAYGHVNNLEASFSTVDIPNMDDSHVMVLCPPEMNNLIYEWGFYSIMGDAWNITQEYRECEVDWDNDEVVVYDHPEVWVSSDSDEETMYMTIRVPNGTLYKIEVLDC
jgi:hypothetical protein